jgi:hypothetical protein
MAGRTKMESVSIAHKACILSIITSGMSFFVATFGVSAYSRVDMIGSICTLLARGALVSMASVILLMPAMFIIFDGLIIRTTAGFRNRKAVSTDKPKSSIRAIPQEITRLAICLSSLHNTQNAIACTYSLTNV